MISGTQVEKLALKRKSGSLKKRVFNDARFGSFGPTLLLKTI